MKKKIFHFLIVIAPIVLTSCKEKLKDGCNCELSGQEVFLDYKGEYYWIEIDTEDEFETYGPYSTSEHGYAAIKRCEEIERQCIENEGNY